MFCLSAARDRLICRHVKENEVAVGVFHDEGFGLPRFVPQGLSDRHICGLAGEEELLDLARAGQRDGGREQARPFADVFGKERLIHSQRRRFRMRPIESGDSLSITGCD